MDSQPFNLQAQGSYGQGSDSGQFETENSPTVKNEEKTLNKVPQQSSSITFVSDTSTQPTEKMRTETIKAIKTQNIYKETGYVKELEAFAAKLLGKEDALYVASGCMGNIICQMLHAKAGETILMANMSHIQMYEAASYAVFGITGKVLKSDRGVYEIDEIPKAINDGEEIFSSKTSVLWLENPTNQGKVCSLEYLEKCYKIAKNKGLSVHMDCARLFNACANLGVEPKDIVKFSDTCLFCLSKGLCAPVGSIISGTKENMQKARRLRHELGGNIPKIGILAAPALVALKEHAPLIKDDNQIAQFLAQRLKQIPYVDINLSDTQINMVFYKIDRQQKKFEDKDYIKHMADNNITVVGALFEGGPFRLVTHYYIREKEAEKFLKHFEEFFDKI